jgi:hypothetical protein
VIPDPVSIGAAQVTSAEPLGDEVTDAVTDVGAPGQLPVPLAQVAAPALLASPSIDTPAIMALATQRRST